MIKIKDLYQKFATIKPLLLNHIIMYVLDINLTDIYLLQDLVLSEVQILDISDGVDAYLKRIPLSRIFCRRKFYGLMLYISPFVFDPRPETEDLVGYIIKNYTPRSILDIGVGSGSIILSLLKNIDNARGIGIDQSAYAIKNAQYNANYLKIDQIAFNDSLDKVSDKFDLIVSNPPYIIGEIDYEAKFDPLISLYENNIYDEIITTKYLNQNANIVLEVPEYSLVYICDLAKSRGFHIYNKFEIGEKIYLIDLKEI